MVGKSDNRSAFRNLGLSRHCLHYLITKAKSPIDGKWCYFVDKCIPFGSSISCALIQKVSEAVPPDSISHIWIFDLAKMLLSIRTDR